MNVVTDEQAAVRMRHLDIYDRNRLIAGADNAIDARRLFAARDFAAYQTRMAGDATKGLPVR